MNQPTGGIAALLGIAIIIALLNVIAWGIYGLIEAGHHIF